MRDPHVEWLEYEMKASWLFDNPPPLQWQTPAFKANLSNALLRAEMRAHFTTVEQARAAVEPFLQTWEIDLGLTYGQREMTFAFRKAQLVDRNPLPPGSAITGTATMTGRASVSATGQAIWKTYPAVPTNFTADPDVVSRWTRFEGFKNGREPLAWRCLNRPQDDAGFGAFHKRRSSMAGGRHSSLDTPRWGDRLRPPAATAHDEAVATTVKLCMDMPIQSAQRSANEPNGADTSVRERIELVMVGGQNRSAKLVGEGHRETIGKRNPPVAFSVPTACQNSVPISAFSATPTRARSFTAPSASIGPLARWKS
jgi:hypothetical protein